MAKIIFYPEKGLHNALSDSYNVKESFANVLGDALNMEKTHGLIGGWGADPRHAAEEMDRMNTFYRKRTSARLLHWMVFLSDEELWSMCEQFQASPAATAVRLGYKVTHMFAYNFQVVFAIYGKEDGMEIHCYLNPISYQDGTVYHDSAKTRQGYLNSTKARLKDYGIAVEAM